MAAALLKAFDDGLNRKLDPGEPEERNIYQAMEAGKQVKKLPMTLGDALDRAREGRGHQVGAARRDVPRCTRTTSATSGSASWPPSRSGTSRRIWTACRKRRRAKRARGERRDIMCGIAGLIHRDGATSDRQGDDGDAAELEASRSGFTGYALYGAPSRTNTSCGSSSPSRRSWPRTTTSARRSGAPGGGRQPLDELGAETIEVSSDALRLPLPHRYGGDTRRLATRSRRSRAQRSSPSAVRSS